VLACGGSLIFSWRVKPDWDALIRNQIRQGVERRGGTMPSEDVIAQQVKIGKLFAQFAPILALVIAPLITVVFAGIYALGLLVMQGQTPFSKVLSVVAWGSCGTDLIKTIVVSASLLIRDPSSIDPTEPGSVSATNLALLLPSGISPVLKALASQVDVFTIWFLILMTIGFAAVSNRRSFKTGNSGTLVFGLFALWVIVRVGWAAISGR
ncbi:MAG TPA: YIP1 family protein, partial [Blastocatellia bacterium]|nr:YIP1 family protein [Blastocatellia bacterium]